MMIVKKTGKPAMALYYAAFLLLSLNLSGQKLANNSFKGINKTSSNKEIKPLDIGDKMPEVIFDKMLNHSTKTGRLSDFKAELVILDFWSTWCGACIQLFPHMNELQKEFGDKLQIILVNGKTQISKDDETKINKTFERLKNKAGLTNKLPIVYDCEELDEYFPWQSIPHEVWIKNGEVIAITGPSEVTKENIKAILSGEKINLHRKKDDLEFDSRQPLFVNGNGGDGNEFLFRSLITKYKEGLGGAIGINSDKNGNITRVYMLNQSLVSIYKRAYQSKMLTYPDNHILIEVKDKSRFNYSPENKYETSYTYELICPPSSDLDIQKYMQQDLERYFGTNVSFDKRKLKCLVLTVADKAKIPYSKNGEPDLDLEKSTLKKYIRNYPISKVVGMLNPYFKMPLVDETGVAVNVDLELPYNLSDLETLKKAFNKMGFALSAEDRDVDVVVITDK